MLLVVPYVFLSPSISSTLPGAEEVLNTTFEWIDKELCQLTKLILEAVSGSFLEEKKWHCRSAVNRISILSHFYRLVMMCVFWSSRFSYAVIFEDQAFMRCLVRVKVTVSSPEAAFLSGRRTYPPGKDGNQGDLGLISRVPQPTELTRPTTKAAEKKSNKHRSSLCNIKTAACIDTHKLAWWFWLSSSQGSQKVVKLVNKHVWLFFSD